eukprot:768458-Hanusia_phi.AAC.2
MLLPPLAGVCSHLTNYMVSNKSKNFRRLGQTSAGDVHISAQVQDTHKENQMTLINHSASNMAQAERERGRERKGDIERKTRRHGGRQKERETDRQTDRSIERQAQRQTQTQTQTQR